MPDILTHSLFGEDVLNSLEGSIWKGKINDNIKLFMLGCQGPDIFFYNDFWPWIKNKRGPEIGRILHLEKTGEFFIDGLKYLKNSLSNDREKDNLFVYLLGFMCHFGLDRIAHPYIFYFTGKYDKNKRDTHRFKGHHKKLELTIDSILMMEKKGIKSFKYPVYKSMNIGKSLPMEIVIFYDYILESLYDIKNVKGIARDSYKDMLRVFRIIFDPYGYKKKILKGLDYILNDKNGYSILTYPRTIDYSRDFLNSNHNKWSHPCYNYETYNSSFYDLYNRGLDESREMILKSISYIEGKNDIGEIEKYFPNLSYSTGKDTKEKCKLRYFQPIFD